MGRRVYFNRSVLVQLNGICLNNVLNYTKKEQIQFIERL